MSAVSHVEGKQYLNLDGLRPSHVLLTAHEVTSAGGNPVLEDVARLVAFVTTPDGAEWKLTHVIKTGRYAEVAGEAAAFDWGIEVLDMREDGIEFRRLG